MYFASDKNIEESDFWGDKEYASFPVMDMFVSSIFFYK